MKRSLTGLQWIAIGGMAALLIASFVIGTAIRGRHNDEADFAASALPSSNIAGGFETLAGVLFIFIVSFVLRFFAYGRIDRRVTVGPVGRGVAIAIEVATVAAVSWLVWIATEPVSGAGYAWLAIWAAGGLWTLVWIIVFLATLVRSRAKVAVGEGEGT